MDTINKQFKLAFNLKSKLVFFPVRHHSPLCSYHLLQTIAKYKPDAILIEGPADTNHLLNNIADPNSKAPLCIYYSYTDEENHRSSCYFPMLDYSPELVAVRQGVQDGINVRFIDLPYSAFPKDTADDESLNNSYYSDYYMARSRYIQELCARQNCRSYAELWEKLFEVNGTEVTTEAFVRNMLGMCYFSRLEYPQELLEKEGNLIREAYMAAEIAKAQVEYKKILVVTGGFHTGALAELVNSGKAATPTQEYRHADSYLIPYSFEESDQLSGYSSGMPYPAFYQRVWRNMGNYGLSDAFSNAVMYFLVKTGGELRSKGTNVSLSEEAAALVQSKGLAQLRNKAQAGLYELLDGITSSYVKSELNILSSQIMKVCKTLLRGTERGAVADNVDVVPLLQDFRNTIKAFGLKQGTTASNEIVLDILSNRKHRQISVFFHRLNFLGVEYAKLLAGPDYKKQDSSRVREKWAYSANAKIEARVIDASYLGGTVKEASTNLINKSRESAATLNCAYYSEQLIDVAVMDLPDFIEPLLDAVRLSVVEDGSFASLGAAVLNLIYLEQVKWLLSSGLMDERLVHTDILDLIYIKACSLLPYLSTKDEKEDRELAAIAKSLYQVAEFQGTDSDIFYEALTALIDTELPPPYLHGAALGLMYSAEKLDTEGTLKYVSGYLFGTGEMMKRSGLFLGGLFYTAWDIIFHHNDFLAGISNVLTELDEESFLAVLPDMRLAFSRFTPINIHRISTAVAGMLGKTEEEVAEQGVPEELLQAGLQLNAYVTERMRERGLI